jgi:transposase InsO family protein
MLQSMSRKARCRDNSPMESFVETLNGERIEQLHFETCAQSRLDIVASIAGFPNHLRSHTSIGYRFSAHMVSSLVGRKCPRDLGKPRATALLSEGPQYAQGR